LLLVPSHVTRMASEMGVDPPDTVIGRDPDLQDGIGIREALPTAVISPIMLPFVPAQTATSVTAAPAVMAATTTASEAQLVAALTPQAPPVATKLEAQIISGFSLTLLYLLVTSRVGVVLPLDPCFG
jgi:hypothetical protein